MKNNVKAKLDMGEKVFGTFLWSASATVAECMGYCGLDFVIIDGEHSPIDMEGTVNMMRAAKLKGLTPFVRAKDHSRSSILKMLDAGAEGIIIPYLKTVEDVKQAIGWGKYQPIGERGFAQGRNPGYGYEPYAQEVQEYFATSNRETLLFPMCETAELLENLEEVVKLEGVDGIFVGPYDLSVALGAPGVFDTKEFREALRYIAHVCRENGKYTIIFSNGPEAAKEHFSLGYHGTALGIDVQTLIQEYRDKVEAVKKIL